MPQPSPQLKAQLTRHASPHQIVIAAVYVALKITGVAPVLPRGAGQVRGAA
jgi:hypothetical protein